MSQVYILLPRLDRYDAMANDALGMAQTLQRLGIPVTLVAAGGNLRGSYISHKKYIARPGNGEDLLIYHYGIAWPDGDELYRGFPGLRILRYHNVTPSHFYEPYHAGIARACEEGLRRVATLPADVSWCVSEYNKESLLATGWQGAAEVLPPFHRIEELAREQLRPGLLKALVTHVRERGSMASEVPTLRLLFVGRQVPNKGIIEMIGKLDGALELLCGNAILTLAGSRDKNLPGYNAKVRAAIRNCRRLKVEQVGSLSEAALKTYLIGADALITFSQHEGFCLPVAEAMALGLPIVASRSPAVKDTLGGPGFVDFTEEAIAARFRAILEDSSEIAEDVRQGRMMYENVYHPQVVQARMELLLRDLWSKKQPEKMNVSLLTDGPAISPTASGRVQSSGRDDVAIIVVRFGEEFAGGSEREAFEYARMLQKSGLDVTVYTTCALSAETWSNHFSAGEELRNGIRIRRFPVDRERTEYWHKLDRLLRQHFSHKWRRRAAQNLALEWIRAQGPFCPEMIAALRNSNHGRYVYMTYLYYPALAGPLVTPQQRNYLVPTLHDEPPAYFGAVAEAAKFHYGLLWNTPEERDLAKRIWGVHGSSLVGAPVGSTEAFQQWLQARRDNRGQSDVDYRAESVIENRSGSRPAGGTDTAARSRAKEGHDGAMKERAEDPAGPPEFLYIGRWDAGKGTAGMMALLREYRKIREFRLRILGGGAARGLPDFAIHEGFVGERKKYDLIASSTALIVPSEMESLSIVTLEGMLCGTPVILNARNAVLRGHAERAGCGLLYSSAREFIQALERSVNMKGDPVLRKGVEYVAGQYSEPVVAERLLRALNL